MRKRGKGKKERKRERESGKGKERLEYSERIKLQSPLNVPILLSDAVSFPYTK